MKNNFLAAVILSLAVVSVCFAQAGPEQLLAEKIKAVKLNAQAELQAKEWIIYLTPQETKRKLTSETDVLTFSDGKVTSRNLSAKGYSTSNMGISSIQDDGTAVWETMQVNAATKDIVFLRGELLASGIMRGTVFFKPQKGDTTTYSYSTIMPEARLEVTQPPKKGKK
mgnify:CR=1 FL=1